MHGCIQVRKEDAPLCFFQENISYRLILILATKFYVGKSCVWLLGYGCRPTVSEKLRNHFGAMHIVPVAKPLNLLCTAEAEVDHTRVHCPIQPSPELVDREHGRRLYGRSLGGRQ